MRKKIKKSTEKKTQPANADESFICAALLEAKKAETLAEVPIGAVAVENGKIIARAHNLREKTFDPLGHAETLLLRKLSRKKKSWRLDGITIYVTVEPCLMCAGAMLQARVKRVVYGCADKKAGAMGSLYDVGSDARLNHRIEVARGVLEKECAAAMSNFFKNLRSKKKKT